MYRGTVEQGGAASAERGPHGRGVGSQVEPSVGAVPVGYGPKAGVVG